MKRIILLIVILFCSAASYSQDVLEVIGKETCSCLEAKKAKNPNLSAADFKSELGVCMLKSYSDHLSEFKDSEKADFSNEEDMGKLGENVALKMLRFCPDLIIQLGRDATKDEGQEVKKEDPSLSGEVVDIKWEQFVTLQLKDQTGRNYNFVLLDSFDTASLLTNNEIKKKDKLKVSYTEVELFDAKAKEFRYYKILTKIEKQ